MRTGLFFGSFNPPHKGHVAIAEHMLRHEGLDEIWFVVSPQNPLKDPKKLAPESDRLAMVELAIVNHKGLKTCDIELSLPRPSFTIDTINTLNLLYPEKKWAIIMGSDGLAYFGQWKDYKTIITKYPRLVYPRSGDDCSNLLNMENARLIEAPMFDVSSTLLRKLLINNDDKLSDYLNNSVLEYIQAHRLYSA
jgi:nicotinate-nucleotide adenylyltransferase